MKTSNMYLHKYNNFNSNSLDELNMHRIFPFFMTSMKFRKKCHVNKGMKPPETYVSVLTLKDESSLFYFGYIKMKKNLI